MQTRFENGKRWRGRTPSDPKQLWGHLRPGPGCRKQIVGCWGPQETPSVPRAGPSGQLGLEPPQRPPGCWGHASWRCGGWRKQAAEIRDGGHSGSPVLLSFPQTDGPKTQWFIWPTWRCPLSLVAEGWSIRIRVPAYFTSPLARLTPLSPCACRHGVTLTDEESARKFMPRSLFSGVPSLRKKL